MVAYSHEPAAAQRQRHVMTIPQVMQLHVGRFDWLDALLDQQLATTEDACHDGRVYARFDEDETPLGTDLDSRLLRAAVNGDHEIVATELRDGCFVDEINVYNQTAIMLAAGMGNFRAMQLLINAGADLELICEQGRTAMHYAVKGNHIKAAAMLIDADADIDVTDPLELITPLHMSCECDFTLMSFFLLKRGANFNVTDSWGFSPLQLAVGPHSNADSAHIVAMLMALDAPMIETPDRRNLIDISFFSHTDIANILREFSPLMSQIYSRTTPRQKQAWRDFQNHDYYKVNFTARSPLALALSLSLACSLILAHALSRSLSLTPNPEPPTPKQNKMQSLLWPANDSLDTDMLDTDSLEAISALLSLQDDT
jgi:hypothetical protein